MSITPKKWAKCKIGEVTEIVSGGTPPSKDSTNFTKEGGMPWITPSDLSGYKNVYISRGVRNLTDKGLRNSSAKPIPAGSVLFSSRAPVGYVAIAKNELATNQGFKNFILPDGLESEFIYYYLRHIKPIAEEMATGTTFKELSGAKAAQLPLLIAPLKVQKRIIEKLNSLLARVDLCHSHLERLPQLLNRYRQSVLTSAIEGTLSKAWRVSHKINENSWQDTTLEEICVKDRVITYGVIKLGKDEPNGIPCLRTSNVRWLSIDEEGMKRIKPEISESYSRTILLGNEVLVNVRGTLGGVSIVKPHMVGWNVSREVAVVPINTKLALPKFIAIWVASNSSQIWLTQKQKGIAYIGINIEDLRQLPVRLPSRKEQAEIVKRVEKLFAYSNHIETRYQSITRLIEQLTPSLLTKAFHGELVKQDPDDESASILLEEIKAQKLARPEKPKRTPKSVEFEERIEMTEDTVKEIILDLPKNKFSFDDLREKFPGDYEDLKDILFNLLGEANPIISQVFDEFAKAIRFVRRSK